MPASISKSNVNVTERSLQDLLTRNTKGNIDITMKAVEEMMKDDPNGTIYIETDSQVISIFPDSKNASNISVQKMDKATSIVGAKKAIAKKEVATIAREVERGRP